MLRSPVESTGVILAAALLATLCVAGTSARLMLA